MNQRTDTSGRQLGEETPLQLWAAAQLFPEQGCCFVSAPPSTICVNFQCKRLCLQEKSECTRRPWAPLAAVMEATPQRAEPLPNRCVTYLNIYFFPHLWIILPSSSVSHAKTKRPWEWRPHPFFHPHLSVGSTLMGSSLISANQNLLILFLHPKRDLKWCRCPQSSSENPQLRLQFHSEAGNS